MPTIVPSGTEMVTTNGRIITGFYCNHTYIHINKYMYALMCMQHAIRCPCTGVLLHIFVIMSVLLANVLVCCFSLYTYIHTYASKNVCVEQIKKYTTQQRNASEQHLLQMKAVIPGAFGNNRGY